MSIDPRSDKVALYYTGDASGNPSLSGVPARDLTENDVHRLLVEEHGTVPTGAALASALDKLYDRLTAGPYRKTNPAASSADKPKER